MAQPVVWWPRGTFSHVVLAMVVYGLACLLAAVTMSMVDQEAAPFGAQQGVAHGVPAFSNADSDVISEVYNWITAEARWFNVGENDGGDKRTSKLSLTILDMVSSGGEASEQHRDVTHDDSSTTNACGPPRRLSIYTGMRWQCVEYARRFLLVRSAVTFGDVVGAEDIWSLPHFLPAVEEELPARSSAASEEAHVPVVKYFANNCSTSTGGTSTPSFPTIGDVLIWKRQKDMPYGHVGVVVGLPTLLVSSSCPPNLDGDAAGACKCYDVPIGEQNYASSFWPADGRHARNLTLLACRDPRTASNDLWGATALFDPTGYELIGYIRPL